MNREFLDYIEDIIDAMAKAQAFTQAMDFDAFVKDDKTVFAVTRAFGDHRRSCQEDTR